MNKAVAAVTFAAVLLFGIGAAFPYLHVHVEPALVGGDAATKSSYSYWSLNGSAMPFIIVYLVLLAATASISLVRQCAATAMASLAGLTVLASRSAALAILAIVYPNRLGHYGVGFYLLLASYVLQVSACVMSLGLLPARRNRPARVAVSLHDLSLAVAVISVSTSTLFSLTTGLGVSRSPFTPLSLRSALLAAVCVVLVFSLIATGLGSLAVRKPMLCGVIAALVLRLAAALRDDIESKLPGTRLAIGFWLSAAALAALIVALTLSPSASRAEEVAKLWEGDQPQPRDGHGS
jgi:hypothetical protein